MTKFFLQLTVVGLLILLTSATPASRTRRQNTFDNLGRGGALPLTVSTNNGSELVNSINRPLSISPQPENGLTPENQFRAPNDLFIRNQRQAQINFGIPPSTTTTARPAIVRTTSSPQFLSCLQTCPSTNQYNPVCGSDGENYHNEYRLECARRCGSPVQMVRAGTCQPL